jgi:hypothetical protein
VREFTEIYGLERGQISFDSDRLDPIFDFDALSLLSVKLSDIKSIRVVPGEVNVLNSLATSSCAVTLPDGRTREFFGAAVLYEVMPDGNAVEDFKQALDISQSRSLRRGLRAVGWDPLRAHQDFIAGRGVELGASPTVTDQRNKDLARAHIIGAELGIIVGSDKSRWRKLLGIWFHGKESSADLNAGELSQLLAILRSLQSAKS